MESLTIGKLARAAGVNLETIRYYQRRGLVVEPLKVQGGYRHYPAETINRIRFIKRAQQLGFTLEEIGDLLLLGDGHCKETQALATRKLAMIETRLADLENMRVTLKELITQCETGSNKAGCPIVESLKASMERG